MSATGHPLIDDAPHEWRVATVNEIKADEKHSCVAGPFGSSISSKFFTPSGVPIIRGSNLTADLEKFVAKDFAFISDDTASRFSAQTVGPDDLVFTCWGTIGQVGLIPRDGPFDRYVISNKQLKLRVNTDVLDPLFAYYFFAAPDTVQFIRDRAIGSAVPGINLGILKGLPVLIPPLETQRRIAGILGAYDDLIEVNRRRVAVLEEMARSLFEEWFVRFRFPGHESVMMIDTPDGPLPEGWKQATVQSAFSLSRGRSYRSVDLADEGGMPFVNLKCMERDGGFRSSGLKRYTGDYKPSHVVRHGEMIMAVTDMTQERRIVGRTGRIPLMSEPEAVISMDLVKVCPLPGIDRAFLYCWLRNSDFGPTAARHANGANVLHLSPKAVVDLPIILPDGEVQCRFGEVVEPIFTLAEVTALANGRLAASRDLLLPRLISGRLSVDVAEKDLEMAA